MMMKMAIKQKNDKGFSLVELLIAISLLAIGLLAAASMQTTAINKNSYADINTTATMVAQQVMDDLMSVELQPNSTVPNTQYWYTLFNQGAANQPYNRFPPINALGTVPTGTTNLQVNGMGTFTANYTLTPNTPTQYVSQVQVWVFLNNNRIPLTFTGYRSLPQQ